MKTIFAICFTIMSFSAFALTAQTAAPAPEFSVKNLWKKVTLTAGTQINMETTEELSSDNMTEGQLVRFKVLTDVYSDNEVVIRTGATATGRVKTIAKASHNNPAVIRIEITMVQAIDGQFVSLNGLEQSLRGTYPGQGVQVKSGTMVSATVMNDIRIKM